MANLKKALAGALALCMAGSMLASCGKDDDSSSSKKDSSSKADSAAATTDTQGGEDTPTTTDGTDDPAPAADPDRTPTTDLHGVDSSEDSKNTLTIYCWNTEFKSRLDAYYEKGAEALPVEKNADGEITSINGVKLNWVQIENEGNAYQTKLDDALAAQADSTEKVDMFLMEADYALKYANGAVALTVTDLGITEDDMSQMYQYTKDVATETATGELKGVSWQATPGLFLYNAAYAEQVLGTSDPDKVQEFVKDWDTFKDTAAKMKDAGIYMVSGYDDAYRLYSAEVSAPWVTDGKINIDPKLKQWVDDTKEFTDNGWNNNTSLWSTEWANGQKTDGKVFGYFFSTWGIPFTLKPNSGAADGEDGGWRACYGPQSYFWGGTWICGAIDSDNTDIVANIMKVMTMDKDVAKAITEGEQDYTNNKAAIQELIDGGYTNDFLGGQNHLALLTEAADKIDLSNKLSAYDQGCNEKFQGAMAEYFKGNLSSYDAALEQFKKDITALYGTLECNF